MAEMIHALTHISEWPSNLYYNITTLPDRMGSKSFIRCVIILGTYIFIRPYIVKFFAWTHLKTNTSKQVLDAGLQKSADEWNDTLVSANDLRSNRGGFTNDEVRKRVAGKEDELRRKIETGEIKQEEMFDLLVDYEEGKDGW